MKTRNLFCLIAVLIIVLNVVCSSANTLKLEKSDNKFFIQAGAFKVQANANNLLVNLKQETKQNWFIENEDELFKVRLGYFEDKRIADSIKESLNIVCYISNKNKEIIQTTTDIKEISNVSTIDSTEEVSMLQAGAFKEKANAIKLRNKMLEETGWNWFVVFDGVLHKVQSGESSNKILYLEDTKIYIDTTEERTVYQPETVVQEEKQTQPIQVVTDITQVFTPCAIKETAQKEIIEKKDTSKIELKEKKLISSVSKNNNDSIIPKHIIIVAFICSFILLILFILIIIMIIRNRKKAKNTG